MTNLEIINAALIKIGAYKVTSLSDGSAESDVASALYAPVRDALLSSYPWSFATIQVAISLHETAPISDYTYAYALPSDHLRTLSVGTAQKSAGAIYRIQSGRIETDQENIILSYIRRVSESDEPAYFTSAFIARLSYEMCIPLTENASRSDVLYKAADMELIRARQVDAQQDTVSSIRTFPLIDARG